MFNLSTNDFNKHSQYNKQNKLGTSVIQNAKHRYVSAARLGDAMGG